MNNCWKKIAINSCSKVILRKPIVRCWKKIAINSCYENKRNSIKGYKKNSIKGYTKKKKKNGHEFISE